MQEPIRLVLHLASDRVRRPVGDILLPWFAYHRKEGDFEIVLPAVPACLLANCWSPNFVNNLLVRAQWRREWEENGRRMEKNGGGWRRMEENGGEWRRMEEEVEKEESNVG